MLSFLKVLTSKVSCGFIQTILNITEFASEAIKSFSSDRD